MWLRRLRAGRLARYAAATVLLAVLGGLAYESWALRSSTETLRKQVASERAASRAADARATAMAAQVATLNTDLLAVAHITGNGHASLSAEIQQLSAETQQLSSDLSDLQSEVGFGTAPGADLGSQVDQLSNAVESLQSQMSSLCLSAGAIGC